MTSAFPTATTGPLANYPLQPVGGGPNVPKDFEVGAPGHTPVPQHAAANATDAANMMSNSGHPTKTAEEYYGETGTKMPATGMPTVNNDQNFIGATDNVTGNTNIGNTNTTMGVGQHGVNTGNNFSGGHSDTVLDITAPDNKTLVVTGAGIGYTMTTTWEKHRELFTVRRGTPDAPSMGNDATNDVAMGTTDDDQTDSQNTNEPFVAQVEPHQIRATKFSWKGGPQIKLKDWLGGRGTHTHVIEEGGKTFEWRKGFTGLSRQLELFETDKPDHRIAWVQKVTTTEADKQPHEHGVPPLPAHPGTAKLTVTSDAMPFIDMVVVSFLLIDRESRNDPLHS